MKKVCIVFLCLFPFVVLSQHIEGQMNDKWKKFEYFIGKWKGEENGMRGYGVGNREYKLILNDQYLHVANTSIYQPQTKNPEGEIHEDWTIFSYDRYSNNYMIRQLNSEDFVNQFALDTTASDASFFQFNSVNIENLPSGFRARLSYTIENINQFREKYELAAPGGEYKVFLENVWRRVNRR
jgi:hypothetical protein